MITTTIAAWLLTYVLHSTVILGVVLVISHALSGRNLAIQETLLRTALLGGVVTASLQLALGIAPIAGEFSLEPAVQPVIAAAVELRHTVSAGPDTGVLSSNRPGDAAWAAPFVVFWFVASTLALVAILRSILDLRRLLRSRCFQSASRLVETLAAAMGLRRTVRVSTSKAISVPFATGIRRPEICCPERVNDLAFEHRRGLFAHELAHVARRDPAWQLVYRLWEALFIVQPLNRLVRRRLEELAEHLTDDRAAASTGDRLGLARCLVVVAHWGHSEGIGLPTTALAAGPRLNRRVGRLISTSADLQINSGWAIAVGVALVTGSALFLPSVAVPPLFAESTATATNNTITWSTADDRPAENPPTGEPAPEPPPAAESPADAPAAAKAPPAPVSPPSAPPPEALPVTGKPPAAPAPATPPVRPAPQAAPAPPAPAAAPSPQSAPAPVAPSTRESERASEQRKEEARERSSERARAEAIARRQRDLAREEAERARELGREAADLARLTEREAAEMRSQIGQLQGEARRLAREAAAAERDRSDAMRAEARSLARQSALRARQLTAEQRAAMSHRASEMRKRAEAGKQGAKMIAEKRARELADQARALAEQAEAERCQQAREKK